MKIDIKKPQDRQKAIVAKEEKERFKSIYQTALSHKRESDKMRAKGGSLRYRKTYILSLLGGVVALTASLIIFLNFYNNHYFHKQEEKRLIEENNPIVHNDSLKEEIVVTQINNEKGGISGKNIFKSKKNNVKIKIKRKHYTKEDLLKMPPDVRAEIKSTYR